MKKGIQRIITILENPKHKQIYNRLIVFKPMNSVDYINANIQGKCALGEIGCQLGMRPIDLFVMKEDAYSLILKRAKIPSALINENLLPFITYEPVTWQLDEAYKRHSIQNKTINIEIGKNDIINDGSNLQQYIHVLNDLGFKYKQIVEFIKITFGSY